MPAGVHEPGARPKTVHSALRLRGKTDIKRLSSRPSKSLGIGDCAAEALAFDAESRERAREPYLSFGCQPDESCPPVLGEATRRMNPDSSARATSSVTVLCASWSRSARLLTVACSLPSGAPL